MCPSVHSYGQNERLILVGKAVMHSLSQMSLRQVVSNYIVSLTIRPIDVQENGRIDFRLQDKAVKVGDTIGRSMVLTNLAQQHKIGNGRYVCFVKEQGPFGRVMKKNKGVL